VYFYQLFEFENTKKAASKTLTVYTFPILLSASLFPTDLSLFCTKSVGSVTAKPVWIVLSAYEKQVCFRMAVLHAAVNDFPAGSWDALGGVSPLFIYGYVRKA